MIAHRLSRAQSKTPSIRHAINYVVGPSRWCHPWPHRYVSTTPVTRSMSGKVAIALGSNLGDRVNNIESAIQLMRKHGVNVDKISHLYETKAMYYEDQGPFLNCACNAETSHQPLALLDTLQAIEIALGRERTITKGPRTIDLDVVMYADEVIQHPRLSVPHPGLPERDFVLRPLNDIIPNITVPPSNAKISELYARLPQRDLSMSPVTQLSPNVPLIRSTDPTRQTHLMAILNLTPDSFSDGGSHDPHDKAKLKETISNFVASGATIIDIGGQSTRPGATPISSSEELSRILPAIRLIRETPAFNPVAISIDTFLPAVAQEAIAAGADIINDISGGQLSNDEILSVVANTNKTIVLMHMRGDPSSMTRLAHYPAGVVEEVSSDLHVRVNAALKAGIPRWRIILDPGIGFAKNEAHNLALLRDLNKLRSAPGLEGYAWLVGTSRKKFIGNITGVKDAGQRVMGTAATVTASIAAGADVVRIHDVSEMRQVVSMADAIYRRAL